jgi:hypothetical protein
MGKIPHEQKVQDDTNRYDDNRCCDQQPGFFHDTFPLWVSAKNLLSLEGSVGKPRLYVKETSPQNMCVVDVSRA